MECLAIFILIFCAAALYDYEVRQRQKLREYHELQRQRLASARNTYRAVLNELKADPSNAELRQAAVSIGREYASLTRELSGNPGVTIYDEVALKNDLDAACAGARSANAISAEEKLRVLHQLHSSGLINDEELSIRRKAILDLI